MGRDDFFRSGITLSIGTDNASFSRSAVFKAVSSGTEISKVGSLQLRVDERQKQRTLEAQQSYDNFFKPAKSRLSKRDNKTRLHSAALSSGAPTSMVPPSTAWSSRRGVATASEQLGQRQKS